MSNQLRMQVVLSALDRATAPLRAIQNQSRGLAGALRQSKDQLRGLEQQQRQIRAFQAMTRQAQDTRTALRDKRAELTEINRRLAETTGPTRRLTQQQQRAQREVGRLSQRYREQVSRSRELARELPAKGEGIRNLGHQQADLARQMEQANARIQRQQDALGRLARADVSGRYRNMTREVGRFGRRATIAITGATAATFGLAHSTANLGDEVAKTAGLMGIGTTELQELQYAAQRAGMETGQLDSSMQRMVRRLGRAAQGGGAAAGAYDDLGLSAKVLADMRPDQALDVIADRLQEVERHTDRVAYASSIFGNEGEAMLRVIEGGSGRLQELREQAHLTGNVLGNDAARDAERFRDALLDAQLDLRGMRHTIGAELMPPITEMMRDMSDWMRENRDQVRALAHAFGNRLANAVPVVADLARGVGRVTGAMGRAISTLADLVGGYERLAMIVATIFATKAIMSVIAFVAGIVQAVAALVSFVGGMGGVIAALKAFGAVLLTTPIGWAIGLVAALAAGAYLLWRHWDAVTDFFRGLWDRILEAFGGGISGVSQLILDWSPLGLFYRAFAGVLGWFGVDLPDRFTEFGKDIIGGIMGGIRERMGDLKDSVQDAGSRVTGWFAERLGIRSPSRVFAEHGSDIMAGLDQGMGTGQGEVSRRIRSIAGMLGRAGSGIGMGLAAGAAAASPIALDQRPPLQTQGGGGVVIQGGIHITVQGGGENAQGIGHEVARQVRLALEEINQEQDARRRSTFGDLD